jgi:hypothetical protein
MQIGFYALCRWLAAVYHYNSSLSEIPGYDPGELLFNYERISRSPLMTACGRPEMPFRQSKGVLP